MTRSLLVVAIALSAGIACWSPPAPPPPPSTAELRDRCLVAVNYDERACRELGFRLIREGSMPEAVEPLTLACGSYPDACRELGLLYLEGRGVPQDIAEGVTKMGTGCITGTRDDAACGWDAVGSLRLPNTPIARRAVERSLDHACRRSTTVGWPCFNYGVALTCGLLGPPDFQHAKGALYRGCSLGDSRACDLDFQLRADPTPPPCTLIGPDPAHPVDLGLNLDPLPPDATLPPDEKPFVRSPIPTGRER